MIFRFIDTKRAGKTRLLGVILSLLLALQCTKQIAGTSSDTDTGTVAMLLNPDLTPAANASVKVYDFRDTSLAYETTTDGNGNYSLAQLYGEYSIWAEKDSFVAYNDSVFLDYSDENIPRDTLLIPGKLIGRIEMEQGDPFSSVTVNALGTHIHTNVQSDGTFTLEGLAEGEYILKFSCSLPDYTPTYSSPVSVISGRETVIEEPFSLNYFGIPYVTGFKATFDTAQSRVHLRWDQTDFPHIQEYVIMRREATSSRMTFVAIAFTTDTSFSESITFFHDSSTPRIFHYKAVIKDQFENIGRAYGYKEIIAVGPELVRTTISFNHRHHAKTIIHDSIPIIATLSNPTRFIGSVRWRTAFDDEPVRVTNFAKNSLIQSDTLWYSSAQYGEDMISVEAIDAGGDPRFAELPLRTQRAVILSAKDMDTLTGIIELRVKAEPSVDSIAVGLDDNFSAPVGIENGIAEIDFDTRIYYPNDIMLLQVRENSTILDSAKVYVENTDPIIGCWVSENDSTIRECYRGNGDIETNRDLGWILGWERNGRTIRLMQAVPSSLYFVPYFTDYNHCTIDGIQFIREE
ncbi:MAG: hypothetical protein GF344_12125 [Chitinivibrionales bacterium]|nr:hypothetical protein [Chitinivibrionales bacterium]MBD3357522.1 hypothetical protein [Chitinivibrionales bacterium]